MIKAVLFDIDGVLIDSIEANIKFFQDLMEAGGYKKPTPEEYRPLFHLTMKDTIKTLAPTATNEEVEKIWKMGRDREVPFPDELVTTPNRVDETVKKLHERYLLGLVTSRVRESIFTNPSLVALREYFSAVASYQDTENHKPSPDPVLFACEKLAVKPWEAVYIGDTEADLLAGKAAGTKVIIYGGYKNEQADASASSFKELPKLVSSLK